MLSIYFVKYSRVTYDAAPNRAPTSGGVSPPVVNSANAAVPPLPLSSASSQDISTNAVLPRREVCNMFLLICVEINVVLVGYVVCLFPNPDIFLTLFNSRSGDLSIPKPPTEVPQTIISPNDQPTSKPTKKGKPMEPGKTLTTRFVFFCLVLSLDPEKRAATYLPSIFSKITLLRLSLSSRRSLTISMRKLRR